MTGYNLRSYDASLNRFLQPDTIVSNPVNPQTWNRYSYVSNRPINTNDPSGHCGVASADPLNPVSYITACVEAIELTVDAWKNGERNPVTLINHYTGATQWKQKTGKWWDNYVKDNETVFSDKPIRERFPAAVRVGGNAVQWAAIIVGGAQAVKSYRSTRYPESQQKLDKLADDVIDWVTEGQGVQSSQPIRNPNGDFILRNNANTRKFRFDFYDTSPHENPHMHLEWIENGKWIKPGGIYPSDVAPK